MDAKMPEKKELPGLTEAAQLAAAGADDGFWADVAEQLDNADEAAKVPVEGRLTVRR